MSLLLNLFYITAFWALTLALAKALSRRYRGLTVKPYYVMVKASVGEGFLRRVERSKVAQAFAYASLAATIISMALFYYYITPIGVQRVMGRPVEGGVVPVIPGVTVSWGALVFIAMSIGIAATVHELMHAIVARRLGIGIRSAGFALAVVIPVAFVELDEKAFESAELRRRAMVYSAGPAANLLVGLLVLLALMLVPPLCCGVLVVDVVSGSAADRAGMASGDVIIGVNGTSVLSVRDFTKALGEYRNRDAVFVFDVVGKDGARRVVIVSKPANETVIGVTITNAPPKGILQNLAVLAETLAFWLFVVNLSLAIVNAAPLFVTDGGRLLNDALTRAFGKLGKDVAIVLQTATLTLLAFSVTLGPLG